MRTETMILVCQDKQIRVTQSQLRLMRKSYRFLVRSCKESFSLDFLEPKIGLAILNYLQHFSQTRPSLLSKPLKTDSLLDCGATQWEQNFTSQFTLEELSDLVVASQLLGMDELLNLGCASIALLLKTSF